MNDANEYLTLDYKLVDGLPLKIDVYPPESAASLEQPAVPAVIYFHGGGLTVGNRRSWFPSWLHERLRAKGIALISADYRLLVPSTGHDVVEDIKDLFSFISNEIDRALSEKCSSRDLTVFRIDSSALAVAGTSAGGLCSYLAVMHASPRPIALLSMYGMAGDVMTDHYLVSKTKPFFRGRELLDPTTFHEYLYPQCETLAPIADSPLAYHPKDSPTPGFPANPRMFITRLYLQQGDVLDYYTGEHGISETIRKNPSQGLELLRETALFPQFGVTSNWPPSLLVHGTDDTAVPIHDSQHMMKLIESVGTDVKLVPVEGKEHSFDYEPMAEELHGKEHGLFDSIVEFLVVRLKRNDTASR